MIKVIIGDLCLVAACPFVSIWYLAFCTIEGRIFGFAFGVSLTGTGIIVTVLLGRVGNRVVGWTVGSIMIVFGIIILMIYAIIGIDYLVKWITKVYIPSVKKRVNDNLSVENP